MADFVAVIRRAVDGLSDNTPEMRVKVYARARGAVQRQLESMKPRPPETMLQRQLEKLEAAIRDVEAEHAEAGVEPVNENDGAAAAAYAPPAESDHAPPQQVSEPEPEYAEDHQHAPEPAHTPDREHAEIPEPAYQQEPEHAAHEEPAHGGAEPAYQPEVAAPAPSADDTWREEDDWAPKPDPQPQPVEEVQEHLYEVPEHERYGEQSASVVSHPLEEEWPRHEAQAEISPPVGEGYAERHEPAHDAAADQFISETHSDPVRGDRAAHFDDVWAETASPEGAARGEPEHAWSMPAAERLDPAHPGPAAMPALYPPDLGFTADAQPAARMPEAVEPFAWDAATFDELPPVKSANVAPVKPVLPTPAGDFDDVDLFSDVHGTPAKPVAKAAPADGWNEIKELSGYEKFAAETDFGDPVPSDLGQVSVAGLQGKSYRMEPRRQRFGVKGILLTLVGVAVVGGAGYAAWANRDALNQMVAGLVSSATKNTAAVDKSATAPAATTPAATTSASTTPAAGTPDASKSTTAPQTASAATPAANAVAPDNDGNTVNTKFTQRLMADGTEVDAGVPPIPGGPVAAEGKSIAQQNVAAATPPPAATPPAAAAQPANPAPPPASPAPDAATPPATAVPSPTANVPSATPPVPTQTATVGSPQKMFLYEERLGQTSPTAIEGTVTWSVQEDKGDDGKPSPTVQGSINVPERGMTALVTFKRNTDPSLPASHLIELVFSLPPNFEGGAIDSVQRVAMKATEQDRGDPLIGVPAKITDDFHMVALNDLPDARKTNLDLLRNRRWIDIPVTYRNGRRALLTMDKGDTGTEAFNKVIGEWAAIAGPSNGQ